MANYFVLLKPLATVAAMDSCGFGRYSGHYWKPPFQTSNSCHHHPFAPLWWHGITAAPITMPAIFFLMFLLIMLASMRRRCYCYTYFNIDDVSCIWHGVYRVSLSDTCCSEQLVIIFWILCWHKSNDSTATLWLQVLSGEFLQLSFNIL
jgi:hypothetical protein